MSQTSEILDVIRAEPGITGQRVKDLCPHIPANSASAILSQLENRGQLSVEVVQQKTARPGRRRNVKQYRFVSEVPMKAPVLKIVQPDVEHLQAEIAQLRQWKAEAILKYPDLGVEPVVIKARSIIADILRKKGDAAGANATLRGFRDNTTLIEAVVAAMEAA